MDEAAFDAFVRDAQRGLLRSAWLLTGTWAEAEDLVQTVLASAWRQWARVSAADRPEAYVQTMLANGFMSSRRTVRWAREVVLADVPDTLAAGQADPELEHAVRAALEQLPPRQRAVVVLRYFCDFSVEDTARALTCTTGTVKSATSRALARLGNTPELVCLREDAS